MRPSEARKWIGFYTAMILTTGASAFWVAIVLLVVTANKSEPEYTAFAVLLAASLGCIVTATVMRIKTIERKAERWYQSAR